MNSEISAAKEATEAIDNSQEEADNGIQGMQKDEPEIVPEKKQEKSILQF